MYHSLNQPINQSTNQSINQSPPILICLLTGTESGSRPEQCRYRDPCGSIPSVLWRIEDRARWQARIRVWGPNLLHSLCRADRAHGFIRTPTRTPRIRCISIPGTITYQYHCQDYLPHFYDHQRAKTYFPFASRQQIIRTPFPTTQHTQKHPSTLAGAMAGARAHDQ